MIIWRQTGQLGRLHFFTIVAHPDEINSQVLCIQMVKEKRHKIIVKNWILWVWYGKGYMKSIKRQELRECLMKATFRRFLH